MLQHLSNYAFLCTIPANKSAATFHSNIFLLSELQTFALVGQWTSAFSENHFVASQFEVILCHTPTCCRCWIVNKRQTVRIFGVAKPTKFHQDSTRLSIASHGTLRVRPRKMASNCVAIWYILIIFYLRSDGISFWSRQVVKKLWQNQQVPARFEVQPVIDQRDRKVQRRGSEHNA